MDSVLINKIMHLQPGALRKLLKKSPNVNAHKLAEIVDYGRDHLIDVARRYIVNHYSELPDAMSIIDKPEVK